MRFTPTHVGNHHLLYFEVLQEILLEGERVTFTNNPDTWVYRASLHLEVELLVVAVRQPEYTAWRALHDDMATSEGHGA